MRAYVIIKSYKIYAATAVVDEDATAPAMESTSAISLKAALKFLNKMTCLRERIRTNWRTTDLLLFFFGLT